MKKIFLFFILMLNVYSLDQLSAIDDENKKVLNWILEDLGLEKESSDVKLKIYDKFSFGLDNTELSHQIQQQKHQRNLCFK